MGSHSNPTRDTTLLFRLLTNKYYVQNAAFAFYVIIATLGILSLLPAAASSLSTRMSFVYLLSVSGYFGGGLFLASLLLLPTRLIKFSRWLTPVLAWTWLVYLSLDVATFNLYHFHINWLLIEMFVMDPRGVGMPAFLIVSSVVMIVGLGGLVFYLHRLSQHTTTKRYFVLGGLLTLLIPAFAANSVIHVWANHYDREEITSIDALFPLYYPVSSHKNGPRISRWLPSVFPAESGERPVASRGESGIVCHPLKPVVFEEPTTPASILVIVLESWQADSLRPDIMPNLCHFASAATRFDQHLSGGSTTVPGLFSLMFGLHPNYYDIFKGSPKSNPCLLTEALHNQGYRSRVFTTSHLDRFAMRSLMFSKVDAGDYCFGNDDQRIVDQFIASLEPKNASQSPRCDFMFLTSSHSPYIYPPKSAKFLPLPLVEGGFALNKSADATPYKNDYHNSLYYCDSLIKKVLDELDRQRRLNNTWIVVTGDHAEEFNENGLGYWGHGSNFTRWQTQTPLLIKSPGQQSGAVESRLSLHQDVMPTLMQNALGCTSPIEHYSNGANLFQLPEKRGTVIASYFTKAYLVDGAIIEVLSGKKYAWNDMKQLRKLSDTMQVKQVMAEERRFLR